MPSHNRPIQKWGRAFFPVWIGQSLSQVGSAVAQFALVWWLTDLTGSAAVLATATTAALIPQIVLGPLAGTYVDRWNRRLVMIVADGIIALLALWLAWLFWSGRMQVWHVYVIMVARAIGGIFHGPAIHAATTMLVPKKELARVQGLNQAMGGAVNLIGPALGALALAFLPLHQVMFVDVTTAVLAMLPLLVVTIPEPDRDTEEAPTDSVWGDTLAGFRYMWRFPGMAAIMFAALLMNFMGSPTWTLLPLYVRNVFGGDATSLGMVQAAFGAGLIAGGLVASAWGGFRSKSVTAFAAFGVTGLAVIVVGGAPATALWLVGVAWFLFAVFNAIGNGTLLALMQAAVAPEMQGRVMSAVLSGVTMATPLGLAVSTPVVEALGLRVWYLAAGAVSVIVSLWAVNSAKVRALDMLDSDDLEDSLRSPGRSDAERMIGTKAS